MMRYIPHTAGDIERLLQAIGVARIEDLFASIPPNLRQAGVIDLPPPLAETALQKHLATLAAQGPTGACFIGAGAYRHYAPSAIDHILHRSEIYTAYTPYQAEIAQGTLQIIFEFQTMIARLLGLEVANASLYDGATAVAEAALMTGRLSKKTRLVVSAGLHPQYLETLRTYLKWTPLEMRLAPLGPDGRTDFQALDSLADDEACGVIVQSPNYFGVIEDTRRIGGLLAGRPARFVHVFSEPLAFALIASPGEAKADIACGEGQSLGIPPSFGGPGLGLFATTQKDMRAMPGRLVGQTVDAEGKRAFCLTLSTREQHIRREKATSNICTNHGLMATAATVYMALIGREGLREIAEQNRAKTEYLKGRLKTVAALPFAAPTFNEFVWTPKRPADDVLAALAKAEILGGVNVSGQAPGLQNAILTCVTEVLEREEIDRYVEVVRSM